MNYKITENQTKLKTLAKWADFVDKRTHSLKDNSSDVYSF